MPRDIFTWAQTTRAFGLVRRWRTWKKIAYLKALSQLRLDLAEHEIAGQLEGPSHFSSTYRKTRITVLVTTCDERVDACITSIRFRDGSGWTPNGGNRRVDPDKHSLASHIRIDLEGNAPSIENIYGHPFLTPGPVNERIDGQSAEPRQPRPARVPLPRSRSRRQLPAGETVRTAQIRPRAVFVGIEIRDIIVANRMTYEPLNENEDNSFSRNSASRYISIIGRAGSGKSIYSNWFSMLCKRPNEPRHPPRALRAVDMTFYLHDERPLDLPATSVLDAEVTEIIRAWKSSKIRARIFVDRHPLASSPPFDRAFARHGHAFAMVVLPLPEPNKGLRERSCVSTPEANRPHHVGGTTIFSSYRRREQQPCTTAFASATTSRPKGPPDIESTIILPNRAAGARLDASWTGNFEAPDCEDYSTGVEIDAPTGSRVMQRSNPDSLFDVCSAQDCKATAT